MERGRTVKRAVPKPFKRKARFVSLLPLVLKFRLHAEPS